MKFYHHHVVHSRLASDCRLKDYRVSVVNIWPVWGHAFVIPKPEAAAEDFMDKRL